MQNAELFNVKDKTVLVTGGSRGIGLMIAKTFVANGAIVYISARSKNVCDKSAGELTKMGPGKCYSIPADLSSIPQVQMLVGELTKRTDRLDVLINNAGANWASPIEEYPIEAFEKVLNLNLKMVFLLSQLCLPLLEKAATEKVPSRIINIGSINGIAPPTLQTFAYSSSKAALHHLSKHLASTLASRHITVNAVAPGPFETKMLAGILDQGRDAIISTTALGRLGCETDMGGVCVFLSSRAGAYITGDVIVVDGGSLIKSLL